MAGHPAYQVGGLRGNLGFLVTCSTEHQDLFTEWQDVLLPDPLKSTSRKAGC